MSLDTIDNNMTMDYKQAKTILRGMMCLNEYEAEAIDIAIKAINALNIK